MKKIVLSLFVFLLLITAYSVEGVCKEPEILRFVTQNGEYLLYKGENVLEKGKSLDDIIPLCNGESVYFDNARIYDKFELSEGEYNFYGTAFFEGEGRVAVSKGAVLNLNGFSAEINGDNGIELNGGILIVNDSRLNCNGEYAINLTNEESDAYILGESIVKGKKGDVISCGNVLLTKDGEKYTSSEPLKILFQKEIPSEKLFGNEKNYFPPVICYNKYGNEIRLCRINYVNEEGYSYSVYKFLGELLDVPMQEAPLGYKFDGWEWGDAVVGEGYSIEGDMTIEASYSLAAPDFQINGVNFVYDGEQRVLSPGEIYHPLLPYGEITYCWYKDGKMVSLEPKIEVENVDDSGKYSLAVVFGYGGEYSYSMVDNIEVLISPKRIFLEYKDEGFVVANASESEDLPDIYNVEKDGVVYAKTLNSNYCLEFTPEKIKNETSSLAVALAFCAVILLIFVCAFYVFKSAEIDKDIAGIAMRANTASGGEIQKKDDGDLSFQSRFFTVTPESANELLSSKLAKNMIKKSGSVYTFGTASESVAIGDLSSNFTAGEIVDINKMKERCLISENAYKVKIISEGNIDKPLTVMANDFDITAVKMIALLGGEAIKVKSKSK